MSSAGEARHELITRAIECAQHLRTMLGDHPALSARSSAPNGHHRRGHPLAQVVTQLTRVHSMLTSAVAAYPHHLSRNPDTGDADPLACALARLLTALTDPVTRYHRHPDHLDHDHDVDVLHHRLRAIWAANSMLITEFAPLDVEVHRYARSLPAETDPRWRAALATAAIHAEPAWSRAAGTERTVHLLGLQMLAIGLFVRSVELDLAPADLTGSQMTELLAPVAHDPLWIALSTTPSGHPGPPAHASTSPRGDIAARDRRVHELRTRVTTALVYAGVNLRRPGGLHRDLVAAWTHLQQPAPPCSDHTLSAAPYTWRPHLPEGALRAAGYLGL